MSARNLDNCGVMTKMRKRGFGYPDRYYYLAKCYGYYLEPNVLYEECRNCRLNVHYKDLEDTEKLSQKQYEDILKFIKGFTQFDSSGEVVKTFTNGYCYYFALILHTRFPDSSIVYYAVGNHFACKIKDRVFDITGDLTYKNLFFEDWEDFKKHDSLGSSRIIKCCIDKLDV